MCRFFAFLLTIIGSAFVIEALSVEDVSRALVLDTAIVDHLKNFLSEASSGKSNQQQAHANIHSHFINEFIREHEKIFGNVQTPNSTEMKGIEAASDPVKSLILTRRISRGWPQLLRISKTVLRQSTWKKVKSEVLKMEKELGIVVEEEDLSSQTDSLARLMHMYKLKPNELTNMGCQRQKSYFSAHLKTLDVALVGGSAFDERLYGTAVHLFFSVRELTEACSETSQEMTTSNRSNLLRHLNHLIHLASKLHDLRLSSDDYKPQPGMFPRLLSKVPISIQREEKEVLTDPLTFRMNLPTSVNHTEEDSLRFAEICRGHNFLSLAERARLKCRLESRGSPYLILMPAMVEEHSLDPYIISFHKALSHKQIQEITDTARPMLEQAKIRAEDGVGPDASFKVRSSYTAWIREERLSMLKKLRVKIEALTGLSADETTSAAEILQVNLYAAGGYYMPHVDAFGLLSDQSENADTAVMLSGGDRIATFMFYMNDVEAGGQTAFPRIGVGVIPAAGNAVFWSNLLPDGFQDTRTMHGACPVLKGIKWVSNKWIRYDQQFQKKPCPLQQASRDVQRI